MGENREIPRGWEWAKLAEVCIFFQGYGFPKDLQGKASGKYPFYKVGDISKNVQAGNNYLEFCENHINEDILKKIKAKVSPKNTIVFAKIGESLKLNRRALIKQPGIVDNNAIGLKADSNICNDFFLFHFLKCLKLENYSRATTVPSVRKTDIEIVEIPLPPLPEQYRIVAKIEELFSSLDKGIENLKTAQQQLKVYRQAVLKWAFEELESERNVEEIMHEHSIGLVRSNNQQNNKGVGLPYIKMNNVDLNGNVDFTKVVFVEVNNNEAKKYALKKGDILINTRNSVELVGKTGIVREEKPNCVFNNNLLRIRTKSGYNPLFIGYQLISPWLRKQMVKEKKSTTNVCALYQRDIFPLKVKVTDSIKQHHIVSQIESRLSVCDKIEETIEQSLKQSEALRQSILKKAFEGKLVPQNPNDEPASKLLERIKAEREIQAAEQRHVNSNRKTNRNTAP